MTTQVLNFRIPHEDAERLKKAATRFGCTATEIILAGIKKEVVWREIKDKLPLPETLVLLDRERGLFTGDEQYRKEFLAELEKAVAIP